MKINYKEQYLINTFCIFVVFFVVFVVYCTQKYAVIKYDDAYCIFWDKELTKFNQIFVSVYHGRYIANFLAKFIGFDIPNFFAIHTNLWIQTGGALIKGIFTAVVMFAISKLAYINKKTDYFYPFVAIIIFIIYQFNMFHKYENVLYTSFYGFIFPFLFYALFIYKVLKCYKIKELTNSDFSVLLILAIFVGSSTEFTIITTFVSFTIILLFKVINGTFSKKYVFVFFTYILSMFSYFFNPGFIETVESKQALNITSAIEIFPDFLVQSIDIFVKEYFIFFNIIILLLILSLLKNKSDKKEILQIVFSLLVASFCFSFSLLFSGYKFPEKTLYVNHFDLVFQTKLFLISIICFQFNFIQNKIKYLLLLFIIFYTFVISKENLIHMKNDIKMCGGIISYLNGSEDAFQYKERYLQERIVAYYAYKYDSFIPILTNEAESFTLGAPRQYIQPLYNSEFEDNEEIKYIIVDTIQEVYDKYLKDGGPIITSDEIENPNWQKLLDKEFVLTGRKK